MAKGDTVELDKVLLIADDQGVTIGTPAIGGAKVIATSQGETRSGKTIVFRYKSKVRYRKKTGHRQLYTRLAIDKVVRSETVQEEPAKKVRRRKREVTESGT